MTLDDHIANFLRDGQFRIAQLSVEMNELKDKGSYSYKELFQKRLSISAFMDILYEGKWLVTSGYNHLQTGSGETWTEYEVQSEIEYLRYTTGMSEAPFITFTAHYPKIASIILGGVSTGSGEIIPDGNVGDLLGFGASGQLISIDPDEWGGHRDSESVTTYFAGRL